MGLAQLQHWARAQVLHDSVRLSTGRPSDLLRPDVNIVHISRRRSPVGPQHFRLQAEQLGMGFRSRVLARTDKPQPAAAELTRQLSVRAVQEWLQADVSELIGVFGEQLGCPHVSAKLEVLGGTPCPRFHADHVGVRLLVSYYGPGTVYLENRHARRRWLWGGDGGGVAVAAADAAAARQAATGDLLFLKGHSAPGNYGMGAVHRSPDLDPNPDSHMNSQLIRNLDLDVNPECTRAGAAGPPPLRLLLTVDDAVAGWAGEGLGGRYHGGHQPQGGCGCGRPHPAVGTNGEAGVGSGLEAEIGAGAHRPDASLRLR